MNTFKEVSFFQIHAFKHVMYHIELSILWLRPVNPTVKA